jgi:alpha-beta hydrolase superfamily lysophospholipase
MPGRRRRWLAGGVLALAAVVGVALLIALRSYLREVSVFFPDRTRLVLSGADAGLPTARDVTFSDGQGEKMRGWYVPSTNGAGVVLLHGAGGNRTAMVPEARELVAAGFGVLLFDWPGQGESDGEIHWSTGEAQALRGAVDFLSQQSEVDPRRLGALGFSMGGAVLARVAPTEPRLASFVFAGTPSDQATQVHLETGQWGPLTEVPARLALQLRGVPLTDDQPRDRIGQLAPRPVLIVSGTRDGTVPLGLAEQLFAAAGTPKDLLVIDGGGHGSYDGAANSPYLARVRDFFQSTLGAPRP